MLRQAYDDMRSQLEGEVQTRIKSEEDLRGFFDTKLDMLSQIQARAEQTTMDREKGIMQQVQSALQQVANLVKEMRDQQSMQHQMVTERTKEHIRESVDKMGQISESIGKRQQVIEGTMGE